MTDVHPHDVVEMFWPFDGPHSDESVADAAEAISRLVRYVANATYRPVRSGPALWRALSSLDAALHGLDQVFEQLGGLTARRLVDDESLFDDRRDRPGAATVKEAFAALARARALLEPAALRLREAAQAACHLGHNVPVTVDNSEAVDW